MAVLQDNKNDENLSNHILVLNRVNIKNIINLPLKATQRIKVRYNMFKCNMIHFLIIFLNGYSTHALMYLRILSFSVLPVEVYMFFAEILVNLYNYFQTK